MLTIAKTLHIDTNHKFNIYSGATRFADYNY